MKESGHLEAAMHQTATIASDKATHIRLRDASWAQKESSSHCVSKKLLGCIIELKGVKS
jgi:hypothetical protein